MLDGEFRHDGRDELRIFSIAHHPSRLVAPIEIRSHICAVLAASLAHKPRLDIEAEDHPASSRH
jgi:hypothetical protein